MTKANQPKVAEESEEAWPFPTEEEARKSLLAGCLDAQKEKIAGLIRSNPELQTYIDERIAEAVAASKKEPSKVKR
jgi:hypothetical protein